MSKHVTSALRHHWLWALLALSLSAGLAQAAGTLVPHSAEYNVRISVIGGRLSTRLTQTGAVYTAEHHIEPTGVARLLSRGDITEISEFTNDPSGIRPVAYRSDDKLTSDKQRADIRFDWDAERATGTVDGEHFEAELVGFSHDRVSIQYQLMLDLLNERPAEHYRMFEIDDQRMLNIRTVETKSVKVPAGTFTAIGVQHQAENSSRVTTLWCVAELGYLPVMIEQHRDGKLKVRATLRNYTPSN